MKGIKKALTGILAATLIMGSSMTAFAENEGTDATNTTEAATSQAAASKTKASGQGGSYQIKVQSTNKNQTYTVYKLFDASTNEARQQAVDAGADSEVTTSGITYTLPSGKNLTNNAWFEETNGYVTLKSGVTASALSTEEFRTWAKGFGVSVVSETADADNQELIFTGLKDGYYFISTTTGTLATVTSVAPDAIVKDKNSVPTVTKTEDQPTNDFEDEVTYTVTFTLQPGSKNVVFHDQLTDGLTLQGTEPTWNLAASNYVLTKWQNETTEGVDDITITFNQSYLDTITAATTLTLTYKAKVNTAAVINEHNDAWINYSENSNVTSEHVTVYESTFAFKVIKVDSNNSPLTGAKFVLSKNGNLGNLTETLTDAQKAELLAFDASGNYTPGGTTFIQSGNDNAEFTFNGLDADPDAAIKYYLYEVTAPNGYNKLTAPIEVVITPTLSGTEVTAFTLAYKIGTEATTINGTIGTTPSFNVVNNSGAVLPSTGGIGTTIFYIIGGLLIIAAVVFFVVRRRGDAE